MSQVIIAGDTSGTITLQAPAVAGSTTLTLPATSGTILQSGTVVTEAQGGNGTTTGYYGFKNRIINGAMVIDQRNAGASVTPTNLAYTLDRWFAGLTQASKFTVQQNAGFVTPPAGFTNYLGVTSSSAYSVLTGDTFYIAQSIEGFNCADLGWGTANAKTVNLSFQVYSSLAGTFGGSITNRTGRSYPFSYTVSSANTWTPISITIAGDTSGTWPTNNTASISVYFGLGSGGTYTGTAGVWAGSVLVQSTGSTSVVGTNGATFYITGVQLEKGSTATSFDYRPYGTELQLCQRYYEMSFQQGTAPQNNYGVGIGGGEQGWVSFSGNNVRQQFSSFKVTKRAAPTITTYNSSNVSTASALGLYSAAWYAITIGTAYSLDTGFRTDSTVTGPTLTTGYSYLYNGFWAASAEL